MSAPQTLRLVLLKDEVLAIPEGYRSLRVRSGQAWVTVDGSDLMLRRGQEAGLERGAHKAVVSTLGALPAVVELVSTRAGLAA
jgi:hypothetical protein